MSETMMVERVRQDTQARLLAGGLEAGKVRVFQAQRTYLREHGILIDLDIHGTSQFYASVDWTLDLGMAEDDERVQRGRLSRGRKVLIKNSKLPSLETRFRANLERHSFSVEAFGGYRYVPDGAFLTWWNNHQELKAQWDAEVERLCDEYDWIVAEAMEDFTLMARDTWLTLVARANGTGNEAILHNYTLKTFTDTVLDIVRDQIPTPRELRSRCTVVVNPATWLLDSESEHDLLEAERLRGERRMLEEEHDLWARQERAMVEQVEAKARAAQAEAYEVQRRERIRTEEERKREQALTDEIRRAQLDLARQAAQDLQNPFEEVVAGLRSQVLDTVRSALQLYRKHGHFRGKVVEAIENMQTSFRMLSAGFVNDYELERALQALAGALDREGVDTKRDSAAIADALAEVADICKGQAADVATFARVTGWEMLEI